MRRGHRRRDHRGDEPDEQPPVRPGVAEHPPQHRAVRRLRWRMSASRRKPIDRAVDVHHRSVRYRRRRAIPVSAHALASVRCMTATAGPAIATDPEVREELIATVRRFVAHEVHPVASELEHADAYPEAIVEQMKALGLFGITIPEEYGGLGLDLLTYIGVIEELAYGWMSLSGIVNTHTIAAHLIVGPRHRRSRSSAGCRASRPASCAAASRSRRPTPGATRATSRAVRRATATSTSINGTKIWVTNGERAGIVALAARTDEGISCFIVEKEPGPGERWAHGEQEHPASSGTRASRPSRCRTTTIASPPTRSSATRVAGSATSSVRSRSVASTSRRAPSAWRAPRSTPRSRTRRSATRSASRSRSTRRSR